VEPFLGGCNVLPHATGPRLAGEIRPELAALYLAIANGWTPPESVSESEYRAIKTAPHQFAPRLVGFVAVACSFGGKWWGGYARGAEGRNYALESSAALLKIADKIASAYIECASYDELRIPDRSIIYCDPPYAGTTGYAMRFDSAKFWAWAEAKTKEGHRVFVSEYTAPDGWRCVWEKEARNSVRKKDGAPRPVERLFTLQSVR
jgi:DNA adenine methylase